MNSSACRGLYGNVPTATALRSMHIAAYIPCVALMPRLAAVTPRGDVEQEAIA